MSRDPANPIINSLLREVLREMNPPDMADRVLHKLEQIDDQQLRTLQEEALVDALLVEPPTATADDRCDSGNSLSETSEKHPTRQLLASLSNNADLLPTASQHAADENAAGPGVAPAAITPSRSSRTRRQHPDWLTPIFWMSCGAACLTIAVTIGTLVIRSLDPDGSPGGLNPLGIGSPSGQIVERDLRSGGSLREKSRSNREELASDTGEPTPALDNSREQPSFGNESLNRIQQLVQADIDETREKRDDVYLVNYINRSIQQEMGSYVMPAAIIEDAAWQSRVTQILLGRAPTTAEHVAFEQQSETDRRAKYVEGLLFGEEYTDEFSRHWAQQLFDHLQTGADSPDGSTVDQEARKSLLAFLTQQLREQAGLDQVLGALLTASGSPLAEHEAFNPASGYLAIAADGGSHVGLTGRVSRVFLGRRLDCVKCHDHPVAEEWQQEDFWKLNAFFRQLKVQQSGDELLIGDVDYVGELNRVDEAVFFFEDEEGEQVSVIPGLDRELISPDGRVTEVHRRSELARAIVNSADFRRNVVNRIWADCFQVGLVRPLDEHGSHNPVSHLQLLNELAEQFAAHQYRLRPLLKWMVLSDPFRRAEATPWNFATDSPHLGRQPLFSRYYGQWDRPSSTLAALTTVVGQRVELSNYGVNRTGIFASRAAIGDKEEPAVSSAGEPDTSVDSNLANAFTMRSSENPWGTLGPDYSEMLDQLAASQLSIERKIEHLFLLAVARQPSPSELDQALSIVEYPAESRGLLEAQSLEKPVPASIDEFPELRLQGLRDLWWTLKLSGESVH